MRTIGLIGAGRWGRNLAKSFSEKTRIKSVVTSGNLENIAKLQKIVPDIEVSTLDSMLSDEDIEAVIVASPIEHLSNIGKLCLQSGKSIFLEKPGAKDVEEIKALMLAKGDSVCLINYLYLTDPSYVAFRTAIRNTSVQKATFTWHKWGTFGNDMLLNLASHELSFLIDSLDNPLVKVGRKSKVEKDRCVLDLKCDNTDVTIKIDRTKMARHKLVIYETDNGTYMWQPGMCENDAGQITSNPTHDLIGIQRDKFLSHLDNDTGHTNLDLAHNVMSVIQELDS